MKHKPINNHPAPFVPEFKPKLTIRVTCGRTKHVAEFTYDLPLDGQIIDLFPLTQKLRMALERLALMPRLLTLPKASPESPEK